MPPEPPKCWVGAGSGATEYFFHQACKESDYTPARREDGSYVYKCFTEKVDGSKV